MNDLDAIEFTAGSLESYLEEYEAKLENGRLPNRRLVEEYRFRQSTEATAVHRLYATSPVREGGELIGYRETSADPSDTPRNSSRDPATHVETLRRMGVYAGRTAQADSVHTDRVADPAEYTGEFQDRVGALPLERSPSIDVPVVSEDARGGVQNRLR